MTSKELAAELDGIEYPVRISKELEAKAKAAGLVIVYGASDDLIEFAGAFMDEAGVNEGGTVRVNKQGLAQAWGDIDHEDEKAMRDYFAHKYEGKKMAITDLTNQPIKVGGGLGNAGRQRITPSTPVHPSAVVAEAEVAFQICAQRDVQTHPCCPRSA